MTDRDMARAIIAEISSEDLDARFYVSSGILNVKTRKLSSEMSDVIRAHKQDIIDYLTTPPDTASICRRGHAVEWRCTVHGIWVCKCYFSPVKQHSPVRDFWMKGIAS